MTKRKIRPLEPADLTDEMIDAALRLWFRHADDDAREMIIKIDSYRADMRHSICAALRAGGK